MHCRWGHSIVHWSRNCSADHTATQTVGHSSIDISVICDTQRPWSFVEDLRRDEICEWWWWWWLYVCVTECAGLFGRSFSRYHPSSTCSVCCCSSFFSLQSSVCDTCSGISSGYCAVHVLCLTDKTISSSILFTMLFWVYRIWQDHKHFWRFHSQLEDTF